MKFIEIDCVNNLEEETTYKALVNVNHIVELWADNHGLINIRVAAGQYVSEYSTLNTFEEIKSLLCESVKELDVYKSMETAFNQDDREEFVKNIKELADK